MSTTLNFFIIIGIFIFLGSTAMGIKFLNWVKKVRAETHDLDTKNIFQEMSIEKTMEKLSSVHENIRDVVAKQREAQRALNDLREEKGKLQEGNCILLSKQNSLTAKNHRIEAEQLQRKIRFDEELEQERLKILKAANEKQKHIIKQATDKIEEFKAEYIVDAETELNGLYPKRLQLLDETRTLQTQLLDLRSDRESWRSQETEAANLVRKIKSLDFALDSSEKLLALRRSTIKKLETAISDLETKESDLAAQAKLAEKTKSSRWTSRLSLLKRLLLLRTTQGLETRILENSDVAWAMSTGYMQLTLTRKGIEVISIKSSVPSVLFTETERKADTEAGL